MPRFVPAEELLVLLNSNTKLIFIAKILLNIIKKYYYTVLFQLLASIEVESTSHDSFQRQCFQEYFYSAMDIFSTRRKIRPFSHEKVVVMQFDACRWFCYPIYAKWLPLNRYAVGYVRWNKFFRFFWLENMRWEN